MWWNDWLICSAAFGVVTPWRRSWILLEDHFRIINNSILDHTFIARCKIELSLTQRTGPMSSDEPIFKTLIVKDMIALQPMDCLKMTDFLETDRAVRSKSNQLVLQLGALKSYVAYQTRWLSTWECNSDLTVSHQTSKGLLGERHSSLHSKAAFTAGVWRFLALGVGVCSDRRTSRREAHHMKTTDRLISISPK